MAATETTMTAGRSLRGKFTADTAWNFGAYGVMAGAGAFVSLFVAGTRGAEALGVFNQVYAIYVVAAQLASAGVHDSAQKHVAEHADSPTLRRVIARSSLGAVARTAVPAAVALALLAPWIGAAADSAGVGHGLLVVAPGLVLFALNKTLLGVLNGLRRMRAFALAQCVRMLAIVGGVVCVGLSAMPSWALAASFTLAELLLLPVLLVAMGDDVRSAHPGDRKAWQRRHRQFGFRALPNGLLAESFIRIDIIMLGLLASDGVVGIYSVAALFVEGLYQLSVVIRTVANPVLVRLIAKGQRSELARFCRRTGVMSLLITTAAGTAVYFAFPLLDWWLPSDLVGQSHGLLPILLCGLVIYSAFVPSDHVLLQAGLPGKQSLLMTGNVLANVCLNGLLILRYGAWGAAAATAVAYLFSAAALMLATARWLGMTRTLFVAPTESIGSRDPSAPP